VTISVTAQDYLYSVRHFKIEPGKSGNYIRCVSRDTAGLLWLGTIHGLVRFNGFQFDHPSDAKASFQLPSSEVFSLANGADSIFIGTKNGLMAWNIRTSKKIEFSDYQDNGEAILATCHEPATGFWWYREDGYLFNLFGGHIRKVRLNLSSPIDIQISGDHLWICGRKRTDLQVTKSGNVIRVNLKNMKPDAVLKSGPQKASFFLYADTNSHIIYVHGDQIYDLDHPGAPRKLTHSLVDGDLTHKLVIGDHRFLVLNQYRLFHEYYAGKLLQRKEIPLGINMPFVIQHIEMAGDKLVMATSVGLIIIGYRLNAFSPILSTKIEGDGNYEDPRGIEEDDEHLYLTGYHSISAWRKSDGSFHVINQQDLLTHGVELYKKKLWLATEGNGLLKLDPITGRYKKIVRDTTIRSNFLISTAAWGDTILVGGYRSFNAYLPDPDKFLNPVIRHDTLSVSDLMVKKILPLDDRRCLLGTEKGIFIIDRSFRVLQHMRPPDRNLYPGIDIINDVVQGTGGSFWAATFHGVVRFDQTGRLTRHTTRREGLAGDFVASLVSDGRGGLWAGTYEGLSRIDTATGRIDNYFRADGLPDDEFNHSSVHLSRSGDIVMGPVSGFIRFDPGLSMPGGIYRNMPKISRTEYGSSEDVKVLLDHPYGNPTTLYIGPDIKYLKLYFYTDPLQTSEQSIYEYKIDGIHQDWMRMGPTPVIHIDNVRSGRYILRVRFITGSGSESITERSFPLVVEQYFYTRPAFYVAIIGALLIFIVLYVRGTMIRDRRLLEVRQELAADLHDEIGGYLTGLYMQIDLMSRNPQQSEWKFVTLRNQARKAVFALKDGLWSLDTKTDNAQQLWDRFKRIAQESLEPLDIPYRFSGFDNMASIALTLMEKRNLLFILKECLTNAIKHGDGRGVWFEWKRHQNGGHRIVVENGWNADHSERQGEGQGLENIRQRIARIRGNAHFTAASGKFIVTLNLILKHDRIGRD